MSIRSGSVVTILLLLSGMACSAEKAPDPGAGSGGLGSTWADAAKMPDLFTGTWWHFGPFVENDAKLNVPFTAQAQKYVDAFKYKRDIAYAGEGCRSPGIPVAMRMAGGLKFTYAPGWISLYMRTVSDTRFIRMNQKQDKTSPKYYGNSVGHWEGDTLVVETVDFMPGITFQYGVGKGLPPAETRGPGISSAPADGGANIVSSLSKAIWGPHGESMRMVERMRLIDPETMEVKTTIYDDTVWTQPYVMAPRNYIRLQKGIRERGEYNGDPEEYVCTVTVTNFDPDTNTYVDKDPEEVVKFLDKQGQ